MSVVLPEQIFLEISASPKQLLFVEKKVKMADVLSLHPPRRQPSKFCGRIIFCFPYLSKRMKKVRNDQSKYVSGPFIDFSIATCR